jgi:hypothetical protein
MGGEEKRITVSVCNDKICSSLVLMCSLHDMEDELNFFNLHILRI